MGGAPPNRLAPVYPMSSRPRCTTGRAGTPGLCVGVSTLRARALPAIHLRGEVWEGAAEAPPKYLLRLRRQAQVGVSAHASRAGHLAIRVGDDREVGRGIAESQAHRIHSVPVATRTMSLRLGDTAPNFPIIA